MHPDEPGRSARGAGGDAIAFQDQHRDPTPREMEGEAGPLHAAPTTITSAVSVMDP